MNNKKTQNQNLKKYLKAKILALELVVVFLFGFFFKQTNIFKAV